MKRYCTVWLFLVLTGCFTSKMPPALTIEQIKTVSNKRYDCVLGIERYKWPAYSDSLNKALQNSGIFKEIVWSDSGKKYDLIVRVEERVYGTPTIPILPILTLGILPSIVEEDHGHVFSFQAKDETSAKIRISTKYTGNTILGWVAIPLWISSSFSIGDPENTLKYKQYFNHMVISGAHEILTNCSKSGV